MFRRSPEATLPCNKFGRALISVQVAGYVILYLKQLVITVKRSIKKEFWFCSFYLWDTDFSYYDI